MGGDRLVPIPRKAKTQIFIKRGILMPSEARTCLRHLEDGIIRADVVDTCIIVAPSIELSAREIEQIVQDLRKVAQKNRIDFDSPDVLSDEDYMTLTGITKENFHVVFNTLPLYFRNSKGRSPRTCLALLLVKLRTGVSHSVLSALFGLPRRKVGRAIDSVRKMLMFSFVPDHLEAHHITRQDFIQLHTSKVAKAIFSPDQERVMLVADATYIYIQKSSNYFFQRRTFSIHKGRPLLKPMIICSTTGYILTVIGPFFADGRNNDANILTSIMKAQHSRLRSWLKEGDLFVVDRGFRDCLDFLEDIGFETKMPSFLQKGSQHTTQEANDSRLVTSVRWIVEAVNGMLKHWRFLDHTIPNTIIPYVGDYLRIVCALCNSFKPPRRTDNYESVLKAERMLQLSKQTNLLQALVGKERWDRRRVVYQTVDNTALPEFPKLSLEELMDLTLGVYQLKQAHSYTKEHLTAEGLYVLSYVRESANNVLRLQIHSRHRSNTQYCLWIKFTTEFYPTFQWYCKCKAGAQVVGCCAHVASVLWYLGYFRHQPEKNININEAAVNSVMDAADADNVGWSEKSDEDDEDDDDDDEETQN